MAEKQVLVGLLPEVVALRPGEQVVWQAEGATLKVEFDPHRCPFSSNIFQAPAGIGVHSGPPRPGSKPGSYRYRVSLNDCVVGHGEVLLRES